MSLPCAPTSGRGETGLGVKRLRWCPAESEMFKKKKNWTPYYLVCLPVDLAAPRVSCGTSRRQKTLLPPAGPRPASRRTRIAKTTGQGPGDPKVIRPWAKDHKWLRETSRSVIVPQSAKLAADTCFVTPDRSDPKSLHIPKTCCLVLGHNLQDINCAYRLTSAQPLVSCLARGPSLYSDLQTRSSAPASPATDHSLPRPTPSTPSATT